MDGFKKTGLIKIFYKISEEERIRYLYSFDLYNDIYVIHDDLGNELKINENELEDNSLEDDNCDEEKDDENYFFEDDSISNKKTNDFKDMLNDLELKYSFNNSDKMELDTD